MFRKLAQYELTLIFVIPVFSVSAQRLSHLQLEGWLGTGDQWPIVLAVQVLLWQDPS